MADCLKRSRYVAVVAVEMFLYANLDIFIPSPSRDPTLVLLKPAQVKLRFGSGLFSLCSGSAQPA